MATEIPNFDAMTDKELMSFWSKYHRPRRKDAAELIGDTRPLYTNIASSLASYACNKAVAMGCRLRGEIESAQTYEKCCDFIYDELPEDLKW